MSVIKNKMSSSNYFPFKPFFFFIIFFCLIFFYTGFNSIPTEVIEGNVGLSSDNLNLIDKSFYLRSSDNYSEYDQLSISFMGKSFTNIRPSFLFPLLIRGVSFFFKVDSFSWNFTLILLCFFSSLITIILISFTAQELYGNNAADISSWLYVLCPYTTFFTLTGGLTTYIPLGVSFCSFVISKSSIFNKRRGRISPLNSSIYLSIGCIYLALLRPNTAIFSIILLLITFLYLINFKSYSYSFEKLYSLIFISVSLSFSIWQIIVTVPYLAFSLTVFIDETGTFFGVSREYLRTQLNFYDDSNLFNQVKKFTYFLIWKIIDFISGISDIRDTHSDFSNLSKSKPILPFLARVSTGFFYLAPLNLIAFLSSIKSRNILIKSGFWIIILGSLVSLSPSIIGVSNSRYIFMFYPIIVVLSSALLRDILRDIKLNAN